MQKPIDRLLSKIFIDENNCWNFTSGITKDGYGAFWMNEFNRSIHAHRASWILHNGVIEASNIYVCHKCDNTKCINPEHLFLGTQQENMTDKVRKNRQAKGITHKCHLYPELTLRGEKNPTAKITDLQVEEMREIYKNSKTTYKELAIKYKISAKQVGNIIRREQRV